MGERDSVQTLISGNRDCSMVKKTRQEIKKQEVSPPGILSILTSEELEHIDIMDDMLEDLFDGEDQLFSFDGIFESSETTTTTTTNRLPKERRVSLTFARRLSITSVIHEDHEYQVESMGERYSVQTLISENRDCSMVKKTRREIKKQEVSPPGILSILTSEELEHQLEHTKVCLAESMERSAMSRKRLNHEVGCSSEYSLRVGFKIARRSNSAPASGLSQSRDRFASYVNSGMHISSRTFSI